MTLITLVIIGWSLFNHITERIRTGNRHTVRCVRRGSSCLLGVRGGPVRKRYRNDDWTQAWCVLESVLVLHKSRVLVGKSITLMSRHS